MALPEAAFGLPITMLILRPFLRAIPGDLEDAALVDGASRFRFFVQILLPLAKPALVTVALLAFVTSWNQFLLPLLVLHTQSHFTLPLGIYTYQTTYSRTRPASWRSPRWPWCPRSASSCAPSATWSPARPAR